MPRGKQHCHAIFWADVHARNVEDMELSIQMFLIMTFDGLFEIRELTRAFSALELFLAFPAGKNQLSPPGNWICFEFVGHSLLDAACRLRRTVNRRSIRSL